MRRLRVSIIGFGSVGRGVARAILDTRERLKGLGLEIVVVGVADSRGGVMDAGGLDLAALLERKEETGSVGGEGVRGLDVIREVDHDLVIEATPTNIEDGEPGLSNMLTAFDCGRHVVTSNKGPLALEYQRLVECAEDNGVQFRYEATVGGAVPILNLVHEALAGSRVLEIEGILNGTCNYILTRMAEESLSYQHVLSEAQELGIAETDPTYDVEGIDSACKLVILANSVFRQNATYRQVEVTGITKITPEALELAGKNNFTIKLVCQASPDTLKVAPRLVPRRHPLSVGGTLNVAAIHTDLAGPIIITGRGAGSLETASAILSDTIHIARTSHS